MNALDYKVINHRWGGRVLVLFLFCPRLRTKVEQKWTKRTKREQTKAENKTWTKLCNWNKTWTPNGV